MKRTTISFSDQERRDADDLTKKMNFSSLGQMIRYAIQYLAKHHDGK